MAGESIPKPVAGNYNSIAAQYARAKAAKDAAEAGKAKAIQKPAKPWSEQLNERKASKFKNGWNWVVGFFVWLL